MEVMEFDSIHMYSHILVGAGQSVVYQYTQCVYVCAHVNMFVHLCTNVIVSMCASTQHILCIWDVYTLDVH